MDEPHIRAYEPLWGEWAVSRTLYAGSGSTVFLLERRRGDRTLYAAAKVLELREDATGPLSQKLASALDEMERMELLGDCGYAVRLLDDQILPVRENGNLIGYDILLRMDYLSCLSDIIREGEQLCEEEIAALGRDICRALEAAHARGIVHRDIKPANLYRTPSGRWQLGDFGVSKRLEATGLLKTVTGTKAYMAPEVAIGEPYDSRADLYSLGIVLYQLLNGNHLPLTDENSTYSEREGAMRRRWKGTRLQPPPTGERRLRYAIVKACAHDPADRYPSAAAFRNALSSNLLPAEGSGKPIRRGLRAALAGAVALCLLLGAGWAHTGWQYHTLRQQAGLSLTSSDGHRYQVIRRNATWESARVYCASQGGHLVTITSRDEENRIIRLLDENGVTISWLGANNLNSSNGFQWITGEPFDYASWGVGEPNNSGGSEHCLMMVKRPTQGWVWNDAPENGYAFYKEQELGFVCEWDK